MEVYLVFQEDKPPLEPHAGLLTKQKSTRVVAHLTLITVM